ncbi:MAG: phenylalanine--tRNA ligase subunit beta [Lachnospiraceae bacterium]|nr:phenylalanine--tRNA ligase subunit beta [Lachnospiraceae bacterium]
MKASDKFLKYYVKDLDVSGKEFAESITLTGTKIETYEKLDKNLEKIVVVKIEKIEKHPNADKLLICKVNTGNDTIQIVTGAPNVYEGMLCPAVLVGGKVAASAHDSNEYPNGIVIKAGKLRGVESYGMLCSIGELGRPADLYGGNNEGIFDMSNIACKPGDDAIKVLHLDDTLYDFEITSNRIDCYSIIGIAKEVAATFNKKFYEPKTTFKPSFKDDKYIEIEVKDKDLCPLFSTRFVKNIKIEDSPEWLKDCLRAVGIRPINNIVDITNFVMMEYGQPMHAYDYDTIRGKKIVVKRAKNGDKFTTLDGQVRELDDSMLTICDGVGVIGLGGIMGGENSMITDSCKNLLLEAASFNGTNIRLSAKKLGLRTEASNLFEKGLDPNNAIKAINRACSLIEDLKCGEICENFIYVYPDENKNVNKNIEVSVSKVNSLLGTNIDSKIMKEILDKIDLKTDLNGDTMTINVPTIRKDINNFADIAEEVMRFYGYDKADETLPNVSIMPHTKTKQDIIEQNAMDIAIFNGFNEAMNYSFESKKVYDMLLYKSDDKERNFITILNPLGEDFQVMRTQLVNGILKSLSINYNRRIKTAKLFELANIYLPLDKNIEVLPDERKTFIMGAYGKDIDFYVFKGFAEEILTKSHVVGNVSFVKNENISYMHPGRTANIFIDDLLVGYVGEVHEIVTKDYEIGSKVYILQLDIKNIIAKSDLTCKYVEISKFPKSDRDLSMTVPKDITVDKIENVFKEKGGKLLNNFELFDIYEGTQVANGFKSIAYNLSFGANDRSLTDEEVDSAIKKIVDGLNTLGIELRK